MIERTRARLAGGALVALLLVTACGGQGAASAGTSPSGATSPAATTAASPSTPATASDAASPSAGASGAASPSEGASPSEAASPSDGASPVAGASLPTGLTGSVVVTGSSTVEPISTGVAEIFNQGNPGAAVTVTGPGTGDGFEQFCAGQADISDASRPIEEDEAAACQQAGIEYVELKVAIDGLSVIASPENQLTCLTFADVYALFGPESEGFGNWTDAQALATELGSQTQFPDAELTITAPGEESGTYDSFIEIALGDLIEERAQEEQLRADYQASGDDNVIIEGVGGTPGGLGFVGYAFAEGAAGRVKLLEVDGGEGCVAPTAETIANGQYPIARDLFIYVNTARASENPAVAGYVDTYLGQGTIEQVLEDVPYIALTAEAMEETRSAWAGR